MGKTRPFDDCRKCIENIKILENNRKHCDNMTVFFFVEEEAIFLPYFSLSLMFDYFTQKHTDLHFLFIFFFFIHGILNTKKGKRKRKRKKERKITTAVFSSYSSSSVPYEL